MEIFLELLTLLVLTRLFSEGAERLGQPASVGELTAGIALALAASLFGTILPFLTQLASSQALHDVAQLGIFFLVLMGGMESKADELHCHSRGAFWVAWVKPYSLYCVECGWDGCFFPRLKTHPCLLF